MSPGYGRNLNFSVVDAFLRNRVEIPKGRQLFVGVFILVMLLLKPQLRLLLPSDGVVLVSFRSKKKELVLTFGI